MEVTSGLSSVFDRSKKTLAGITYVMLNKKKASGSMVNPEAFS